MGIAQRPSAEPCAAVRAAAGAAVVPNIAGESERRLLSADQRLYLLGVYGTDYDPELSVRVGAVADNSLWGGAITEDL